MRVACGVCVVQNPQKKHAERERREEREKKIVLCVLGKKKEESID